MVTEENVVTPASFGQATQYSAPMGVALHSLVPAQSHPCAAAAQPAFPVCCFQPLLREMRHE